MLDDPLRAQSLSLIVGVILADFELVTAVAGKTDARNEEIRAMLQSFIGRMGSVPPSAWGGVAAARFRCRRSVECGVDEAPRRPAADCGDHRLQRANPA
jgi:hypothetical protein